ncbi:MAG: alpha-amylase [Saprospiraceae bacterium]|nr:alpha-amylase [Saprospiraceae bacterium]
MKNNRAIWGRFLSLLLWAFSLAFWVSCKPEAREAAGIPALEPSTAAPAWADNANIYEVNIRQYTPEGTFTAFATHLPRLKAMGVDILWFMPIFPVSVERRKGTLGSYYAVSDFTAVNPEFGTMADFRAVVDSAKQLGMRVILDWVPNHTGWDHRWITEHPDFYTRNDTGEIIDPIDPKTGKSWGWTDVADLNYDNPELRKAMTQDMLFWLREVGVDGFRCDVASEVPDDFWSEAVPQLRQANPDLFMLAEAEHPPHRNLEWFAMSYGWSFHQLMNQIAQGEAKASDIKTWLAKDRKDFRKGYAMQFITNHDENSWNGTEFERMGEAVKAMAVLAFTFEGMPLIYSGQEAGLNRRLEFFEKDSIQWDNLPYEVFYRTLLDLKHRNKALWNGAAGGEPIIISTEHDDKTLVFFREKEDNKVIVLLNLSPDPLDIVLKDKRLEGSYSNVFGNSSTAVTTGTSIHLSAWDYVILSK